MGARPDSFDFSEPVLAALEEAVDSGDFTLEGFTY